MRVGPEDDPVAWLIDTSHLLPPHELGPVVARALAACGATDVALHLIDHDERRLNRLWPPAVGSASIEVDGTVAGAAYAAGRTRAEALEGAARQWVPLLDGTARLGVVAVDLPAPSPHPALVAQVERVVALAAELLVAKEQYTDDFEVARRCRPMTLAAELQRSNLPPNALVTPAVAVAGILQPAYAVAGDSFDYALGAAGLDVAVLDSVGHDLASALVSHLVQGSLRNSRRRGLDLVESYEVADATLASMYPDHRFATAAFGHLDPATGSFRWVSAGHPAPLVVRGNEVTGEASTVATMPIGLRHTGVPAVNQVDLAPGDSLVLYTDGVTEGGARGGERFGLERFVDVLERVLDEAVPPAEVLRRLVHAVLAHSAYELHDDTTIVLVQRRRQP